MFGKDEIPLPAPAMYQYDLRPSPGLAVGSPRHGPAREASNAFGFLRRLVRPHEVHGRSPQAESELGDLGRPGPVPIVQSSCGIDRSVWQIQPASDLTSFGYFLCQAMADYGSTEVSPSAAAQAPYLGPRRSTWRC